VKNLSKFGLGSILTGFVFAGLSMGGASAAPECTAANFTVNGVFDQTGYLECLSPKLPPTGSDSNDFLGVGIAFGVLGLSGVLVARRPASK